MKVSTNRLYSVAFGFAYAMALPLQAGISWDTLSHYISGKTFFISYVYNKLRDRSIACEPKPFDIPSDLPSPENLARTIAHHIDPHVFLRGASTSEHQYSKRCTPQICSWSRFAQTNKLPQPTAEHYPIDWWTHYRSYIDYAKNNLHLNAIRFSIEWPLVQPDGPHSFDHDALNHYAQLFVYAIKQGITPLVCFHHYTDPCWFLDAGGFAKSRNIHFFVTFCNTVYERIMTEISKNRRTRTALSAMNPRQPLWATFNAPEGYAFRGYHQQQGPPNDPQLSGLPVVARVLKNMLEAHVQVYHKLKHTHRKLGAHCDVPCIGFLKNIHQLDPAQNTWVEHILSPLTRCMCSFADMIQNGAIYQFFTTGEYRVHIPFMVNMHYTNKAAIGALDFIGLNYYANRHMFLTKTIKPTNQDLCSDNTIYYRYPQGMYRAIVELSEKMARPLGIPLYIAENGIATNDDMKRNKFYHEYLYAISKAIQDGYPVYGYFPWALATNYEWPTLTENTQRDYGICAVNSNNPAQLIVKDGSQSLVTFTKQLAQT